MKRAAQMDGGVFYIAAQRAGLEPSTQTLNKIVDLVNQGMTPEAAAKEVKQKMGLKSGGLVKKPKRMI